MEPIKIHCTCGNSFVWTVSGQEFFKEKGYDAPKRCTDCRKKKVIRTINSGRREDQRRRQFDDDLN